jgi:hypothetical protein
MADARRDEKPYCQVPEFSMDLLVDDLAQARRDCNAANVTFVAEFELTAERFFIRDPDGLVWEIIQDNMDSA